MGLVYCGIKKVDENLQVFKELRARGLPWDHVTDGEPMGSTAMVRKACFQKAGIFDTDLRYYEDMDLYYRIYKKGYIFAYTQKALYIYRYHQTNISKNRRIMLESIDRYYGKHLEAADRRTRSKILGQKYSQKGLAHFHFNIILAAGYGFLAFVLYPGYTYRFFLKRLSDRFS